MSSSETIWPLIAWDVLFKELWRHIWRKNEPRPHPPEPGKVNSGRQGPNKPAPIKWHSPSNRPAAFNRPARIRRPAIVNHPDPISHPDPGELTGASWRQKEYIGQLLPRLPSGTPVPAALWLAAKEEKNGREKTSELILRLQKTAGFKRCYRVVDENGNHEKESLERLYGRCYAVRWDIEDIITHIRRRKYVDKSKDYDVDRVNIPWDVVSAPGGGQDRKERAFVNYLPPTERNE